MNLPLVFSESDTFALAGLLATIAKEEPISDQQRKFAALIFVRMDSAVKSQQYASKPAPIRADLRPAPMFHRDKKRKR